MNENALLIELKKRGLKAESQVPIKVLYKENVVGEYIADIHFAQLRSYLKATSLKVGLLLNFSKPTLEVKRIVN